MGKSPVAKADSALSDALAASEAAQALLKASTDAMINPQVLMEAVRDSDGRVVDFVFRTANRAALSHLGLSEEEVIGGSVLKTLPSRDGPGLLPRMAQCLDDGEPVSIDDFPYFTETLGEARTYEIRATKAGADLLAMTWSDVTERSQFLERIAASEELYRLLAENAGDLVCHTREDNKGRHIIVWISPNVEAVLGAPPQHWVGRALLELVSPEDAQAHAARWKKVRGGGGAVSQRVRMSSVDGVVHWFHARIKPYFDAQGHRDGAVIAAHLVDDEVASELAVAQARRMQAVADERYRRSMENAAVGMCMITPEGRIEDVNDSLCQLLGYDADTLRQKTWQDVTAPQYLKENLTNVNDILQGRIDSFRMINQYVHADGHLIWGDHSVSCIRDADDRVENFLVQITDITAQVQANERIRTMAQQLQQQTERLTTELKSAASYMSSIMPTGLTGKVNVSSRYLPSSELGGDCFDYIWIDDDHLLVYLIDVSGHGLEPALLSVSVHNMLRSRSMSTETLLTPEAVLTELNHRFQMDQHHEHYFTMWCGVYQASSRTLRYASAGAPPALAFNSAIGSDVVVTELPTTSEPIGMFKDTEFTSRTYAIPPGSRVLVYSDGASEITLADDRQLRWSDFKDLASQVAASPDWTLDGLIDELNALTPSEAFEDDCSLIQLKFPQCGDQKFT